MDKPTGTLSILLSKSLQKSEINVAVYPQRKRGRI